MNENSIIQDEFDYIVIGAGAAGCVVASEIVKDGRFSVCLIEQGRKDTSRWIHIPATMFKTLNTRDASRVISEPDASLDDRNFVVPQGTVVGGGSSINGMIYMRGQAKDYDDWVYNHGCTGWRLDIQGPLVNYLSFGRLDRSTAY